MYSKGSNHKSVNALWEKYQKYMPLCKKIEGYKNRFYTVNVFNGHS